MGNQDNPLPGFESTQTDSEHLADIIWFIKGRMSACIDRGVSCELDAGHIEALRRFRCDLPKVEALRQRCHAAEHREKLREFFDAQKAKKRGAK